MRSSHSIRAGLSTAATLYRNLPYDTRTALTSIGLLTDVEVDEGGALYVADAGDRSGNGGAIYRINVRGEVQLILDSHRFPRLKTPNSLPLSSAWFHSLSSEKGPSGESWNRRASQTDTLAKT